MSDERLRLLERRWKETASKEASVEYMRECIRCGVEGDLPIEAWIGCVNKSIRPEVITVREEGDRMVLVRSPRMPNFAFFVWAQRRSGTMWSIKFRQDEGESRNFHLICACCPVESYGHPDKDSLSNVLRAQLRRELRDRLAFICMEKRIHTVFMRKTAEWGHRFGRIEGVRMVEGDKYWQFLKEDYSADEIRRDMRFISNPNLL